jgi:hypothetical protein
MERQKVLTVSGCPDSETKQLAAFICGELFLFKWQRFTAFQGLPFPSSNGALYFDNEYPAMTSIEAINEAIRENGYEPVGDFTLPDSAWWDDYYTPLKAKFPSLKQKYEGDEEALDIIAMSEAEIDIRRRYGQSYGYHFFVARKVD